MEKTDQCFHLMDGIGSCYGKVLNFSFFCKNVHHFARCKAQNCDVGKFVKKLIDNIKSTCLMDQKKNFSIRHRLEREDI